MTNLDSILNSRDISTGITLPTKVRLVKAKVFPVVMYGYESWTVKKAECQRTDAFELWCLRRLLRVPWTARRSNQSILKEISPGCSLERLMLKLKLQYFGHLMWRADSFGLPFSSLGYPPDPGIKPRSPALQVDYLLSEPPGKPSAIWFPLNTALTASYKCRWVAFSFSSKYFKIYLEISSLTGALFGSVFFSLYMFGDDVAVFLLLVYIVVWEQALYDIYSLNLLRGVLWVSWWELCPGECFTWVLEECVFCCCK